MSAKEPDPFILFSDSALSELEHDAFDLEKKLGVIRSAILNPKTETPFTVMVTGGWGSGKTSAMAWLQKSLEDKSSKPGKSGVRVDSCWFFPWKYQKQDDVWRGLIAEVIFAITKAHDLDANHRWQTLLRFTAYLGKLVMSPLLATKLKAGDPKAAGIETGFADWAKEIASATDEFFDPEAAYLNDFEKTLEEWIFSYYPEDGNRRLVVFIDDLDRCNPDIALQVLEALKLYLSIPNLIFIVGVDRTVIDQIVAKSYCDMVGDKAMEGKFKDKAAKYLDKMFQVEINVEPTDHELTSFFEDRIEKADTWKVIPEEIRQTIKLLFTDNYEGMSDRTPRTLVRQINRLLISAHRDSGEGTITPAQAMQRELIDLICQEKGYGDDLPQRSKTGREFFRKWSGIIQANMADIQAGRLASYYPTDETGKTRSIYESSALDNNSSFHSLGDDVAQTSEHSPDPRLSHLSSLRDHAYLKYSNLLTSATLARLLEMPYVGNKEEMKSNTDIVRGWIASKTGVQRERVTNEEISNLEILDISDLDVNDISPLNQLTKLLELYCNNTSVKDLSPLSKLKLLDTLSLANTQVSDISVVRSLPKMNSLNLNRTKILTISDLSNCRNLVELSIRDTQVSDISALADLYNLQSLSCSYTFVNTLSPLAKLNKINTLGFYGTKISDLKPIINNVHLWNLGCSHSLLADLTYLKCFEELKSLDVANTLVSDLSPLSRLTQLRELNFSSTSVKNLSVIEHLNRLRSATFEDTEISDLSPFSTLTELRNLSCSKTTISDLSPLLELSTLRTFDCRETKVTKAEVEKLQEALPDCKIYSDYT